MVRHYLSDNGTDNSSDLSGSAESGKPNPPNLLGRGTEVAVFPDMHWNPAHGPELLINAPIPIAIAGNLGLPPIAVVLRRDVVDRTTMPEASVDEHGHLCPGKGYVWGAWEPLEVDAKPKASAVELPSELELGLRVLPGHARQMTAHRWVQGLGSWLSHGGILPLMGLR